MPHSAEPRLLIYAETRDGVVHLSGLGDDGLVTENAIAVAVRRLVVLARIMSLDTNRRGRAIRIKRGRLTLQ